MSMKFGNSGMSMAEFRATYNGPETQMYRKMNSQLNCAQNFKQVQNMAQMMGLGNLDQSSIFTIADANGDGYISKKEAANAMGTLSRLAQMNMLNGGGQVQSSGGGGGGSNAMSILNGVTDLAGNIFGTGDSSGGGSSGGIIGKAGDIIGGLFGGGGSDSGSSGGGGGIIEKAGNFLGGLFG